VIKKLHEDGKLSRDDMTRELENVGFKKGDKLDMTLGQLSGGWKMKMGLVRAMLMEADILMMDEPTGHLDNSTVHGSLITSNHSRQAPDQSLSLPPRTTRAIWRQPPPTS